MPSGRIHFVIPSRDESFSTLQSTILALAEAVPEGVCYLIDDRTRTELKPDLALVASRWPSVVVGRTAGVGGAGRAMAEGIRLALDQALDEEWICTVEADSSVQAKDVLAGCADSAPDQEVVFFSRDWRAGVSAFPAGREMLSRAASLVHAGARRRGPRDWTLFYRGYRARWLRRARLDLDAGPADFSWQAWMAHRVLESGAVFRDVPVRFDYRRHPVSQWRRHLRHTLAHLRLAAKERAS